MASRHPLREHHLGLTLVRADPLAYTIIYGEVDGPQVCAEVDRTVETALAPMVTQIKAKRRQPLHGYMGHQTGDLQSGIFSLIETVFREEVSVFGERRPKTVRL
jgi:hypothetical protein